MEARTAEAAKTPGQRAFEAIHADCLGSGVPCRAWDDLHEDTRATFEKGAHAARADLEQQLDAVSAERDKAYRERAQLVAFIASQYPSEIRDITKDWPVVFIDTPAGQLSWHLSQDDIYLFGHVPQAADSASAKWDGHTTEQKYERLAELTDHQAQCGCDQMRGPERALDGREVPGVPDDTREGTGDGERGGQRRTDGDKNWRPE